MIGGFKLFFICLCWGTGCFLLAVDLEVSEQGKMDFGSFPAREDKSHTFKLLNATQKTVKIQKIRTTCGCLIGQVSAQEIRPGETVLIQTQIKAHSVQGKFVKNIYVETDLPSRRFLRLELKGTARPLVEIFPTAPFFVGKLKAGKKYEFRFTLVATERGVDLAVPAASGCRLEKEDETKWTAICTLIPQAEQKTVDKVFGINVVSPEKHPQISIRIRGVLEE